MPSRDQDVPWPGRTWYAGKWQTPEQVKKIRVRTREYQRRRYAAMTPEQRAAENACRYQPRVHESRRCSECDASFTPRRVDMRFCSKACRERRRGRDPNVYQVKNDRRNDLNRDLFSFGRWKRRRREQLAAARVARQPKIDWSDREAVNAYARAAYARNPESWFRAAHTRRARLKGAAVVENISRRKVLDRDGWCCRICKRTVRDDVVRGHPRKAILAHIVALAPGGDHSWDNVCCLCHECNSRDSVNRLPIQMGLSVG